jgi:hypothetical protein
MRGIPKTDRCQGHENEPSTGFIARLLGRGQTAFDRRDRGGYAKADDESALGLPKLPAAQGLAEQRSQQTNVQHPDEDENRAGREQQPPGSAEFGAQGDKGQSGNRSSPTSGLGAEEP